MKKEFFPWFVLILVVVIGGIFGSLICRQNRQLFLMNQKLQNFSNKNNVAGNTVVKNKKVDTEPSKAEKDISALENSVKNSNGEMETLKRVMSELAKKNGLTTTQHFILGQFNTDVSLILPEPAYIVEESSTSDYPYRGYKIHWSEYPELQVSITDNPNPPDSFAEKCKTAESKKISLAGIEFCEVKGEDAGMGKSYDTTTYSTQYKDTPVVIEFVSQYSYNGAGSILYPYSKEYYQTEQKNIEKLIPEIIKTIKIKPFEQVE